MVSDISCMGLYYKVINGIALLEIDILFLDAVIFHCPHLYVCIKAESSLVMEIRRLVRSLCYVRLVKGHAKFLLVYISINFQ